MSEIKSQPGQIRAVIHITRKATGQTETHELVLTPMESQNGSDAQRDPTQHDCNGSPGRD